MFEKIFNHIKNNKNKENNNNLEKEKFDYKILLQQMIEKQIINRGITDRKIINAFLKVPRHLFVPDNFKENAYEDHPLPIGYNQTISQPYIVALMTYILSLDKKDKVLEIGTGSGYQTAILAELSDKVYTVERIKELSINTQRILNELGYKNIFFHIGDGTEGWSDFSPYDKILVTASCFDVPAPLISQLKQTGKIVIPLGGNYSQILTIVEKKDDKIIKKEVTGCIFVPLIGKYGWKN